MHPNSEFSQPRVAVVLAYFNGSKWIEDQLQSIEDQDYPNIDVFIFDDASERTEREALASVVGRYKRIKSVVYRPRNLGFQMNFLEGLKEVKREYDYYAFSDQDDIWYPNKISRAVEILIANNSDYKLYGSRTEIWCDKKKKSVGFSPLMKKPPSFGNSLVQNIMGGNTMVFCNRLKTVLIKINTKPVSHDWITYQLGTGVDGFVFYDAKPSLLYRQTGTNLVGHNRSIKAKWIRLKRMINNDFKKMNDVQAKCRNGILDSLTTQNKEAHRMFESRYEGKSSNKRKIMEKFGIRRQTVLQNISLAIGVSLKKI